MTFKPSSYISNLRKLGATNPCQDQLRPDHPGRVSELWNPHSHYLIQVKFLRIGHRHMWNSTNYFLVNLSVVDLLMALLNTLFNFIFMRDKNWPFGSTYCTINNFVAYLTVAASVLTLMAITLDRYRAILYPLKPKLSKWYILLAIFCVWGFSCLVAFPALIYSKTFSNTKVTACLLYWPDGLPFVSMYDYVYNIFFFITTYVIPMILMGICYTRMGRHLWGSSIVGEETPALLKNYQNKKRVVKMFFIIVTIFGVCWLPYHVYFIYAYHDNSIVNKAFIQHVYLFFYWLAMANTMVNPIVYYWMNKRFRKYFIRVLFFLPRLLSCNWNFVVGKPANANGIEMGTVSNGFGRDSRSGHHIMERSRSHNVVSMATGYSPRAVSPYHQGYGLRVNHSRRNADKLSRFDNFPSMQCLNRQPSARSNDLLTPQNGTVTSTTTNATSFASSPTPSKTYLVVHNVSLAHRQNVSLTLLEQQDLTSEDTCGHEKVCV
eukprot:maker-scaffold590_size129399-snap-gene-0.30 protein:Tk08098 transcript:maker-scaffold590_size129399-snap-gene-0.30-mRNA-1 annotation:"tachykinin-like peptides receptor 86c-like isoform x1"